jgi:hypothetical protein
MNLNLQYPWSGPFELRGPPKRKEAQAPVVKAIAINELVHDTTRDTTHDLSIELISAT